MLAAATASFPLRHTPGPPSPARAPPTSAEEEARGEAGKAPPRHPTSPDTSHREPAPERARVCAGRPTALRRGIIITVRLRGGFPTTPTPPTPLKPV